MTSTDKRIQLRPLNCLHLARAAAGMSDSSWNDSVQITACYACLGAGSLFFSELMQEWCSSEQQQILCPIFESKNGPSISPSQTSLLHSWAPYNMHASRSSNRRLRCVAAGVDWRLLQHSLLGAALIEPLPAHVCIELHQPAPATKAVQGLVLVLAQDAGEVQHPDEAPWCALLPGRVIARAEGQQVPGAGQPIQDACMSEHNSHSKSHSLRHNPGA